MKTLIKSQSLAAGVLLATTSLVFGQGTMIFDQQSFGESNYGEFLANIQGNQPIGQSFTLSLDGVGFIRLYISDNFFDGIGTTIFVNLRAGSITGAVLGATLPVSLPDRFHGPTNFFFSAQIPVAPGTTYFLQPVVQSGQDFATGYDGRYGYTGETAFFNGNADSINDLWFREGIVPEPSAIALALIGGGVFTYARKNQNRPRSK